MSAGHEFGYTPTWGAPARLPASYVLISGDVETPVGVVIDAKQPTFAGCDNKHFSLL